MSNPISSKNSKIAGAPTPQNTPASVLQNSFLKSNPVSQSIPNTISEETAQNALQSAFANNPALLEAIQGKLGNLVGADSGYVNSLPKEIKNCIYALKKVQDDVFQLEKQFQLELFELEKKYIAKYAPLHSHRAKIISGLVKPTADEIEQGKKIEAELEPAEDEDELEEEDEEEEDEESEPIEGIPAFWLTALENLETISETLTERDVEVLEYLTDIQLSYLDVPGYQLDFHFKENPYFSNSILSKKYYYQEELGYSGDFVYDHAEGTEIEWTSNEENVTVAVEVRKQRNKNTKQVRTVEKISPVESFFNFFDPPTIPEGDEDSEDDEELEGRLALDYGIGEEIKDKLIPRAVDWFTGTAVEMDFAEDEEEEEFEEGSDFDDESESESEEEVKKEQPPECKQQ